MKKLLLFVLSCALLCPPAGAAPKTRLGEEGFKKAEGLQPAADKKKQEVDDATEDMGTGVDNTREKREREQRDSQSAKEGNIQSREKMIRDERVRQEKAQTFLKNALEQRQKATRAMLDNPGSKEAKDKFKQSQQSVQTGAAELNKRRDNIYRLQIANDKDRHGRDWVEKSETIRPKPYVPPVVRLDGPVKPVPQPTKPVSKPKPESEPAQSTASKKAPPKPESTEPPAHLKDAVDDLRGDIKKHKDEVANYEANVEKWRKALDRYNQNHDPELGERLKRAKEKLLAEKERLKDQKADLLGRKNDLTKECSDSHSSGLYASVTGFGIYEADPSVSRDLVRNVARDAGRDAASEAAKAAAAKAAAEAAKLAAKEAAKLAAKETAKKTAKDTSKGTGSSAASSAAHGAAHSAVPSH